MFDRLREDVQTVFDKDPAARSVWEVLTCYPGLHAVWFSRLANWLWRHHLRYPGRLVSPLARWFTGIEIPPGARLGRRVFIDHGMGVVIGETAEVGDDVLMYQGVVLGGTSLQKEKRHPTIGKNVTIGSGAIVLGPIVVGDNARVGAGSVVVRAVPPGATVVGVPARLTGTPDTSRATADLQHGDLPDPVVRAISESLDRQGKLEERLRALEKKLVSFHPSAAPVAVNGVVKPELAESIRAALNEVLDPEVGLSLVQMGFVSDVLVDEDHGVEVRLALDDPHCPMIEYLVDQVRRKVRCVNGVQHVLVTLLEAPPGQTAECQDAVTART